VSHEEDAAVLAALQRQLDAAAGGGSCRRRKWEQLRQRLFAEQLDFIEDPCRRKVLLCSRRAGKTYTLVAYHALRALAVTVFHGVYVTLVRDQAKRLFWEPLLQLDDELELGIDFHHADLIARFRHGPRITVRGAENDADVEKFRGDKYDLFTLDEAGLPQFTGRLKNMVRQVVGPALLDRRGTLAMTGTPGHILKGEFFDATGPQASELDAEALHAMSRPWVERDDAKWQSVEWTWSLHGWTLEQNTAQPHIWEEALAEKRRNGWSDDSPGWRREFCGQWVPDDSLLVFRFHSGRNTWEPVGRPAFEHLPTGHTWRCVLSCDMGFADPFAVHVWAHSDTHPNAYHVYEYSAAGLTVGRIAEEIRRAHATCGGEENFDAQVGDFDTLGGTIHETLSAEHGIALTKAVKKDKRDHIELTNNELVDARIFVLAGSQLENEWTYLSWDDTGLKEKSSQPNHCSDAALYAIRHLRHRASTQAAAVPPPGSPEALAQWARDAEEQRAEERFEKRQRGDLFDWDGSETDDGSWYYE
jgi:hypothetical protein